jgi:hypothetical protein
VRNYLAQMQAGALKPRNCVVKTLPKLLPTDRKMLGLLKQAGVGRPVPCFVPA